MRSELVFSALGPAPGRYRLCRLTAKAGRKLHTRKNRIQDTLNDVLLLLSNSTMADDGAIAGEITASELPHNPAPAFRRPTVQWPENCNKPCGREVDLARVSVGDRAV